MGPIISVFTHCRTSYSTSISTTYDLNFRNFSLFERKKLPLRSPDFHGWRWHGEVFWNTDTFNVCTYVRTSYKAHFPHNSYKYIVQIYMERPLPYTHKLNMESDLQSLFGLHAHSCTHWLKPRNSSPPRAFALGSYTRVLLVSQNRRHLFVTPCVHRTIFDLGIKVHIYILIINSSIYLCGVDYKSVYSYMCL